MIGKRLIANVSANISVRRWFWVITVVVGIFLGLGMSQMIQLHEATAEAQDGGLSELAAELDAIKAKHEMIQAKWQSELLAQVVPTLADESNAAKRQFVDFLEEIGNPGTPALVAMLKDPAKRVRKEAVDALGEIGEDERKAGRNYDAAAIGLAMALEDASDEVIREALQELDDVRPTSAASLAVIVPALIKARTTDSSRARDEVLDILGQSANSSQRMDSLLMQFVML